MTYSHHSTHNLRIQLTTFLAFFLFVVVCPFALRAQSSPLWVRAFGSSGNGSNVANAIKTAPDQNLYVTGQFSGTATFGSTSISSAGGSDIFVAKYSPSGTLLWIAQSGGTQDDAGQGINLDADGNVYVTGNFSGITTFYSANPKDKKITVNPGTGDFSGNGGTFLAKYTSSGTLLWVQTGIGYGIFAGYGVAVSATAQTVYIATQGAGYYVTLSSADGTSNLLVGTSPWFMILAKYDTSGNFQWGGIVSVYYLLFSIWMTAPVRRLVFAGKHCALNTQVGQRLVQALENAIASFVDCFSVCHLCLIT